MCPSLVLCLVLWLKVAATSVIYTLSLHDALPILQLGNETGNVAYAGRPDDRPWSERHPDRSEEHTSELQSLRHLVCRLLLEKKKSKWRMPSSNLAIRDKPSRRSF